MSGVLELTPSRLYALPLVFGLDRARSMFPPAARGFGSANCYLLKEGDRALLIDTGFPAFRAEVLGLLDGMLEPSTELSTIVLRPAEISAVGTLFAILEQRGFRYRRTGPFI